MPKQEWFVRTAVWNKRRHEYEFVRDGYWTEDEARAAMQKIKLTEDVLQKAIVHDDDEDVEVVELWTLMSDGEGREI